MSDLGDTFETELPDVDDPSATDFEVEESPTFEPPAVDDVPAPPVEIAMDDAPPAMDVAVDAPVDAPVESSEAPPPPIDPASTPSSVASAPVLDAASTPIDLVDIDQPPAPVDPASIPGDVTGAPSDLDIDDDGTPRVTVEDEMAEEPTEPETDIVADDPTDLEAISAMNELERHFDEVGDQLAPAEEPLFDPDFDVPDERTILLDHRQVLVISPDAPPRIYDLDGGVITDGADIPWINPDIRSTVELNFGSDDQQLVWDPERGLLLIDGDREIPIEDLLAEHPDLIPDNFVVDEDTPGPDQPPAADREPAADTERTVVVRHEPPTTEIRQTVTPAPEPPPAAPAPIDLSMPDGSVTEAVTELLGVDPADLDDASPEDIKALFTDKDIDAEVVSNQTVGDLRDLLDDGKDVLVAVDTDELFGGDDDDADGGDGADAVMKLIEIDEARGVVILEGPDGERIEVDLDDFRNAWDDSDKSLVIADAPWEDRGGFGSALRTAGLVVVPVAVAGGAAAAAAGVAKRKGTVRGLAES